MANKDTTNPSKLRRFAVSHLTIVKNDAQIHFTHPNQHSTEKKAQYSLCSEGSCLTAFSKCTTNPSKLRRLAVSHLTIVKNAMSTVEESRAVHKKVEFPYISELNHKYVANKGNANSCIERKLS